MGRFINHDPIGERGGVNLHAFVGNNGVNRADLLGMVSILDDTDPLKLKRWDTPDGLEPPSEQSADEDWYAGYVSASGDDSGFGYDGLTILHNGFATGGTMTSMQIVDTYAPIFSANEYARFIAAEEQAQRGASTKLFNSTIKAPSVYLGKKKDDKEIDAPRSGAVGIYLFDPRRPAKGEVIYSDRNLPASSAASSIKQAKQAMALLIANSPTFKAAYDARMSRAYGVVINLVSGTNGGTLSGTNIVVGTSAGVRDNGSIVYPAYVIAHEFGHEYQLTDRNNAAWNVNPSVGSPEALIAPDSAEWYGYHFAEQVAREVRANAGVNIGTQRDYWDVGDRIKDLGMLPSVKYK